MVARRTNRADHVDRGHVDRFQFDLRWLLGLMVVFSLVALGFSIHMVAAYLAIVIALPLFVGLFCFYHLQTQYWTGVRTIVISAILASITFFATALIVFGFKAGEVLFLSPMMGLMAGLVTSFVPLLFYVWVDNLVDRYRHGQL